MQSHALMHTTDMAFSQRLGQLRKERGLTQQGLADLAEEDERGPDELKLQFEAVKQFDEQERKTTLEVLDGLILKHQAKRMVEACSGPDPYK